jgi:hypothetical protein
VAFGPAQWIIRVDARLSFMEKIEG